MSVETPAAAPEETVEPQRCPRCGAQLHLGQDWCLECGEAVSTRIARSPGWKLPAAIVGGVVALAAAVLLLAFLELSDDADRAASVPSPTATPTATPEATPTATPTEDATDPEASPTPEQSPTPAPAAEVASWPAGEEAWTVVVLSSTSKADADRRAKELVDAGTPAGVLRSDDYSSLRAGYWVVFSGQYETREEAQTAA